MLEAAASAQTRSSQIPGVRPYEEDLKVMTKAEKDSVRMVSELWNSYVSSFVDSEVTDERRREMWVDGSPDYLQEFDDGNLLYGTFRENRIEDIRKLGSGVYEITVVTRSKLSGEYGDWVECVYRVCAMAVADAKQGENPFRLCNYLDALIPIMKKIEGQGVNFYTEGQAVDKKVQTDVAEFVESFKDEYDIHEADPINMVIGTSADECIRMSGCIFNVYHNPLMTQGSLKYTNGLFYGKVFPSSVILTNYFDDRHDIILTLLNQAHPDALPMIREGMAIYHGGWMNYDYGTLRSCFDRFLEENPTIDLTDMDNLYETYVPISRKGSDRTEILIPIEYLAGAFIVENVFSRDGAWKVEKLLTCTNYPEVFQVLGVAVSDINKYFR